MDKEKGTLDDVKGLLRRYEKYRVCLGCYLHLLSKFGSRKAVVSLFHSFS